MPRINPRWSVNYEKDYRKAMSFYFCVASPGGVASIKKVVITKSNIIQKEDIDEIDFIFRDFFDRGHYYSQIINLEDPKIVIDEENNTITIDGSLLDAEKEKCIEGDLIEFSFDISTRRTIRGKLKKAECEIIYKD